MNIKEPLISQFIDDELSLGEKRDFLVELARDPAFAQEALALVEQEIRLDSEPFFAIETPPESLAAPRRLLPGGRAALALAASILLLVLGGFFHAYITRAPQGPALVAHRFVLYRPDAPQVEISGSFNGWRPVAMRPAGNSGYWEAVLNLPPGESRFSYLVGRDGRIPDPTVLAREADGFGGENSILNLEA